MVTANRPTLPPRARRSPEARRQATRAGIIALARGCAITAVGLLTYAVAPFDHLTGDVVVWLLLWIVALVAAVAWEVWAVMRSTSPWPQAAEAITLSLVLLLVPFASAYVGMSAADPQAFSQTLNRVDGMYFTVTVFSTVGFGDITPVAEPARIVVSVQMLLDLLVIGVIIKLLTGAAQARRAALLSDERDGAAGRS